MTAAWIAGLNHGAGVWISAMGRACWQGAIALVLAWVLCLALPWMPGRVRSWLWRLAYLKLLVALLWTTPVDLPLLPAPSSLPHAAPAAVTTRPEPFFTVRHSNDGGPARTAPPGTPGERPSAAGWLLLVWLAGVSVCGARVGREWCETRRLRGSCEPVKEERLRASCAELCRRLGQRRAPALLRAAGEGGPLLVGVSSPAIVLPASLLADCAPAELDLMLAHELAHVQGHDLRWNCLTSLAQSLFFFHPLVWLAGREWHLAHEMACDEIAVRITHAPVGDYGEVLLKVAAQQPRPSQTGRLTLGVLDSYDTLTRRVLAMKEIPPVFRERMARVASVLVALGVVGLVPWRVTAQAFPRSGQEALRVLDRVPAGASVALPGPSGTETRALRTLQQPVAAAVIQPRQDRETPPARDRMPSEVSPAPVARTRDATPVLRTLHPPLRHPVRDKVVQPRPAPEVLAARDRMPSEDSSALPGTTGTGSPALSMIRQPVREEVAPPRPGQESPAARDRMLSDEDAPALSDTTGSEAPVSRTIQQLLSDPVGAAVVQVRGQIVQAIGGNAFLLDDGTGQLIVHGGPPWYHTLALPVGETVSVIGELSVGSGEGRGRGKGHARPGGAHLPEINLLRVMEADGTVINVRGPGRPPWAGGPHRERED
jgi:beta-lactamase regulating signal transducer with metallopeptidase domain